jgi:Ca2+-binding RTX toxin-like protein
VVRPRGPGDTLTGGRGHDTFVFDANFGSDIIKNFNVKNDVIQFDVALFVNYAAVMKDTKQVGPDSVIQYDANNSVTLDNVTASSLSSRNFHFS